MIKRIMLVCLASALSALADEVIIEVTTNGGTNTTTSGDIVGYIEDITIDVITAATTADVSVVTSPSLSTMTGVTLVNANDLAADTVFRTRLDGTDAAGTALTSDDPGKFYCNNALILSVSDASATGRVFKAIIKYKK
jgi:hypothetical protein